MVNYLFIGGEFDGQWREASGDIEIVFAELVGDSWDMVCYVRQTWVRKSVLFAQRSSWDVRPQEVYVLDSLSADEATQLRNRV